jgi:hypothetical protein
MRYLLCVVLLAVGCKHPTEPCREWEIVRQPNNPAYHADTALATCTSPKYK